MQYSYDDIRVIVAELTAYRKSALMVRIDLEEKILQWKDSMQWNNNFVRSLSPECVCVIRNTLPLTCLLSWPQNENEDCENVECSSPVSRDVSWQAKVILADGKELKLGARCCYPEQWPEFRSMVETVSRLPFRMRS